MSQPRTHVGGTLTPECNGLCRPDEGIHAGVAYSNYEDIEIAWQRSIERWKTIEVLDLKPTNEVEPYRGTKPHMDHAWLVIFRMRSSGD